MKSMMWQCWVLVSSFGIMEKQLKNFFIQKRKFNDIKEYREKPISIFGNIISNMEKGKLIGVLKLIYFLLKLLSDGKLVNFTPNKKKKK